MEATVASYQIGTALRHVTLSKSLHSVVLILQMVPDFRVGMKLMFSTRSMQQAILIALLKSAT